jgi:hypothetical protein
VSARPLVTRTVETLVGAVQVKRPYFYCPSGCGGFYPLDAALGLHSGRLQLDVQQAAADVATELPYETAATHVQGGVVRGSEFCSGAPP